MASEGKRLWKKGVLVGVCVFVLAVIAIQFVRVDQTPIPIVEAETIKAGIEVPPDIDMILTRSCADCHSNATVYPWYTNIQPAAWFMSGHITEGRQHLNFSVFNTYPAKKKRKKLEEVCDEVKSGAMPLPSYLWIHRDAVLGESEIRAICAWTEVAAGQVKDGR
ncbi:MAG TPA: heme-binding domain-containing protein [Pyrinomonadaceae bacterium]|nr:heme-binding domain-containing protein [Pyrinomonadaceae bacterium]